jgi:invasion protein IalB
MISNSKTGRIPMNSFQKYSVFLLTVVVAVTLAVTSFAAVEAKKDTAAAAPAAAANNNKAQKNQVVESGWTQRCPQKKADPKADPKAAQTAAPTTDKKQCEIFQRIAMKETSARVAEFAVGFPQEKGFEKGAARGAVILPLGILLEEGVQMKIDAGKPLGFKTRFCTNAGCFSFVTLSKDVLENMKKAKSVTFLFKTFAGQNVNMVMSMVNFEKTLKAIQ